MRLIIPVLMMSSAAWAQEWNPLDARAKGMGNAGTALAEGAAASYWNPANLAKESPEPFGISSGFGINISGQGDLAVEGDTIAALDRLSDLYEGLNFQLAQNNLNTAGGADDASLQSAIQILDAINSLNEDGTGLYFTGGGSMEVRFGSFSLFHRANITAGGDPIFDLVNGISFSSLNQNQFYSQITGGALSAAGTNLMNNMIAGGFPAAQDADGDGTPDVQELAFNAQQSLGDAGISDPNFQSTFITTSIATNSGLALGQPGNTLYSNGSGIVFQGILMRETGISVGVPLSIIPIPFFSTINVGIAIKEVIGETFYAKVLLSDLPDGESIVDDVRRQYKENRERSNQFSMDAGISVSPLPWLTAGISAKNLIPMHFDSKFGEDIDIGPQVRMGVGFTPLGLLKIGMDVDLLENDLDQFVDGLKSRMGGAGVELTLPFISLRTGMFTNLSNVASSGGVWTGGIGMNLSIIHIDINGQLALSETRIETGSLINGTDSVRVPERFSASVSVGMELKF